MGAIIRITNSGRRRGGVLETIGRKIVNNQREIAPGLFISGQPTPDELRNLGLAGFKAVINLRGADEDGVVADEGALVEAAGVRYAAIAMSPEALDMAAVERFGAALQGNLPAVAHCGSGGRAGIMMLLHLAKVNGWTLEQTLGEGEKLGIAPGPGSKYRAAFERLFNAECGM